MDTGNRRPPVGRDRNYTAMNQGIIIVAHPANKLFLDDLLSDLQECPYPIVIVYNTDENNGWEYRGIEVGRNLFHNFILLHDTLRVKHIGLMEDMFLYTGKVSLLGKFNGFMGKYGDSIPSFATPNSKQESILLEVIWSNVCTSSDYDEIFERDDFIDGWSLTDRIETIHGQERMVYENDYIIKYKGTYK